MGDPDWSHAMQPHPDGFVLDLEVVPNADRAEFPAGYDPWRRRLKARVTAPATEGRANDELVWILSEFFHVPSTNVRVLSGAASRQKRIAVTGATIETASSRIQEALHET